MFYVVCRSVVGEEFIIIDQRSVLLECGHDLYISVFYRWYFHCWINTMVDKKRENNDFVLLITLKSFRYSVSIGNSEGWWMMVSLSIIMLAEGSTSWWLWRSYGDWKRSHGEIWINCAEFDGNQVRVTIINEVHFYGVGYTTFKYSVIDPRVRSVDFSSVAVLVGWCSITSVFLGWSETHVDRQGSYVRR